MILANTLRCSSYFKETHERRCLNLLFLAVNDPARVSSPPLGAADKWLTENRSGLSFLGDLGLKRCCFNSSQFRAHSWITRWTWAPPLIKCKTVSREYIPPWNLVPARRARGLRWRRGEDQGDRRKWEMSTHLLCLFLKIQMRSGSL